MNFIVVMTKTVAKYTIFADNNTCNLMKRYKSALYFTNPGNRFKW